MKKHPSDACEQSKVSLQERPLTNEGDDGSILVNVNPRQRTRLSGLRLRMGLIRDKNERNPKLPKWTGRAEELGMTCSIPAREAETGDGREILTRINLGLESQALGTKTHS
jgi:hypothetical protein